MFVAVTHFSPSLIFAGMAEAYRSGVTKGRHQALTTNIRLGRTLLIATSTGLMRYLLITTIKSFTVQAPGAFIIKLITAAINSVT